jgi:hypothetical protein
MRGRITRNPAKFDKHRRQYCGGSGFENGKIAANLPIMPAISQLCPLF